MICNLLYVALNCHVDEIYSRFLPAGKHKSDHDCVVLSQGLNALAG